MLTSAQLARLCQELDRTLYPDCRQLVDWLATSCRVPYPVSDLTDRLHRLSANALDALSYEWTTAVPCAVDAAVQTAFLADTLLPLLEAADAGTAAVYFADAAHPTHHIRASYVWTHTGQERPLLTVSGRERVNLNLIERFWNFLRQKIIDPHFYRTKGAFKTTVLPFFHRLDEYGEELASLLTRNFHVLDAQTTSR